MGHVSVVRATGAAPDKLSKQSGDCVISADPPRGRESCAVFDPVWNDAALPPEDVFRA